MNIKEKLMRLTMEAHRDTDKAVSELHRLMVNNSLCSPFALAVFKEAAICQVCSANLFDDEYFVDDEFDTLTDDDLLKCLHEKCTGLLKDIDYRVTEAPFSHQQESELAGKSRALEVLRAALRTRKSK